jgi:hypothetical protein
MKDNFLVSSHEQDVDGFALRLVCIKNKKWEDTFFAVCLTYFIFLYYSYDYLIWFVEAGNTTMQRYKYSYRCSVGILLQNILSTILSQMNALGWRV